MSYATIRVDISADGEPLQSVEIQPDDANRRPRRCTITLGDTSGETFSYRHEYGTLDHLLASALAKAWWDR